MVFCKDCKYFMSHAKLCSYDPRKIVKKIPDTSIRPGREEMRIEYKKCEVQNVDNRCSKFEKKKWWSN